MRKTELSRWKQLLAMAWPLIIANSFWNLQLTIDRIFLGMHSTEALGAALAVTGVFWVPMALLQGTAGYITTFVAQYFGAEEQNKIGRCVWQALYVGTIGGLAFLMLNIFSPWLFKEIGHSEIIQTLEIEYFNALAYSALPIALVAAIGGFFIGIGKTRAVTGINFVGLVLNAALGYIMIFGNFGCPKMGVTGAGYATAIGTYGAAFYGLFLLFTHENEKRFKVLSQWRVDWALIRQFLKFGLPSGLQWAFEGMAFTVFLIILGQVPNGDVALSSSSLAVTVMMLAILPSMGVAQAVMTLVGQYLGQKNPKAAVQVTWDGVKICCIYMVLVGLSFYLIPEFYLMWFKNDANPDMWAGVTQLAPMLLKIVAIFTLFDSVYFNISFALKGAGDTRFVSAVALVLPWPLFVLPTHLLREVPDGILWSWRTVAVYSMITTGVLFLRFRGGKWKSMSVIASPREGVS